MSSAPTAKQPTIKDVAKEAGVCTSTASRALAGKGPDFRISPTTVEKVRQAARRINYRGSAIARSLRTQRSGLIGIVVPDISNPVFASIVGAVTRAVEENGYGVLIADSREETRHEQSHLSELAARQVEGLIVCPVGQVADHLVTLAVSGMPLVTVDRVFEEPTLPTVRSDQQNGARLAVEALTAAGHRNIGCLQGIPNTLPSRERIDGYRNALATAGIEYDPALVEGGTFTVVGGAIASDQLLRRRPDVTALFALSNQIAVGALSTIRRFQLGVPQDLSLVAFDDHPLAPYLETPLTTCDQNEKQLGVEAAMLLLEQLRTGKLPQTKDRIVEVSFRSRSSIAPPRSGDLDPSTWPAPLPSEQNDACIPETSQ